MLYFVFNVRVCALIVHTLFIFYIMTNEEKQQLLLKDLCARLQYKPHCRVFKLNEDIKENDDILYGIIGDNVITLKSDEDECLMYYQIKPYLRSMSNMTEEELNELHNLLVEAANDDNRIALLFTIELDYYNSHHLDYRGLIPMGLALVAPEGMYN